MKKVRFNFLQVAERNRVGALGSSMSQSVEDAIDAMVASWRSGGALRANTANKTGYLLNESAPTSYASASPADRLILQDILRSHVDALGTPHIGEYSVGDFGPTLTSRGSQVGPLESMIAAQTAPGNLMVNLTAAVGFDSNGEYDLYAVPAISEGGWAQKIWDSSELMAAPAGSVQLLSESSIGAVAIGGTHLDVTVPHSLNGSYYLLAMLRVTFSAIAYHVNYLPLALSTT